MPIADFYVAASETVAWLKDHRIDVILVGLRYARSMAGDLHYQAIRAAIQEIAKEQKVLGISRYNAEETLEKIRREQGEPIGGLEVSEAGYACMAEYLARAIAIGIFAKAPSPPTPPNHKEP